MNFTADLSFRLVIVVAFIIYPLLVGLFSGLGTSKQFRVHALIGEFVIGVGTILYMYFNYTTLFAINQGFLFLYVLISGIMFRNGNRLGKYMVGEKQ